MWHVSVARITPRGPAPLWRWPIGEEVRARGLALSIVRGVGAGELFWKRGDIAVHLRRQLADDELATIAAARPGWLELPAIDEAG